MEGDISHRLTDHVDCVNALCRLCGQKPKREKGRNRKDILCAAFVSEIQTVYNVNVLDDEDGKHSKLMCVVCYRTLNILKNNVQPGTERSCNARMKFEAAACLWKRYDDTISAEQCATCAHFLLQRKSGRPPKTQPDKRKLAANVDDSTESVSNSPADKDSEMLDVSFHPSAASTSTPAKVPRLSDMQTSPFAKFVSTATSPFNSKRVVRFKEQQVE